MDPGLMQVQLKRNAEDMQEYLKSLDSWEEDMKKRDNLLSKQKPILKKTIPPIRGQASKKTEQKVPDNSSTQSERIKSFDYNAWSKFDVDAACEDTPSSASSEEEEEESERKEEDRRKKMAELEKERGNQLFKEGKYQAAVERYTKAMNLDPTSHILPSNRAMALIKLKQYAAAETDCNLSIALEEKYVKSWQRRATARANLGKFEEALDDFREVLKLDPSSKTTILEIKKLQEKIANQPKRKTIKPHLAETRDPKFVLPVKRPSHMRSKKPLVRINVEEVGGGTGAFEIAQGADQQQGGEVTGEVRQEEGEEQYEVGPVRTAAVPSVPSSSIEFMSHWKSLRCNEQLLVQYFKSIPPCKYPVLLNQSLETVVFSEILTILQEHYNDCSSLIDTLQWLSKVPRFSVATMFLSKADKQKLTAIFQTLLTSRDKQETIQHLAKQYSIKI